MYLPTGTYFGNKGRDFLRVYGSEDCTKTLVELEDLFISPLIRKDMKALNYMSTLSPPSTQYWYIQ